MKAALKTENKESTICFLDQVYAYLMSLTGSKRNKLYKTPRRTPRIGLLVAIKTTKALFYQLLGESKPFQYFLIYKLSQDHLELLFCAVRAFGRFHNNPTASNLQEVSDERSSKDHEWKCHNIQQRF